MRKRDLALTVQCRVTADYLACVATNNWNLDEDRSFTRDQLIAEAGRTLTILGELAFCAALSPDRHARISRHPRLAEARALVAELFPELAESPEVPA